MRRLYNMTQGENEWDKGLWVWVCVYQCVVVCMERDVSPDLGRTAALVSVWKGRERGVCWKGMRRTAK